MQKTKKSIAKRYKVTGSGKIMRNRAGKRHLLSCKSPKQRRRLGTETELAKGDYDRIRVNLPFNNKV